MRGYVPPVSFGAVLAALGTGTVIGVGVAVVFHRLYLIPVVIGVALALGIVYIFLMLGSPESDPELPPVGADEPFEDPVEEADRLGASGDAGEVAPPSEAGSLSFDRSPPAPAPAPLTADEVADEEPGYDPVEDADRRDAATPPKEAPASRDEDPK
ncbi:MAG: hypothetical protein WA688_01685 [Thermoplasmata archaeon]